MSKTIINTGTLQNAVKAMSALVEEAVFVFSPDGMTSQAVDASNAALAAITIPNTAFIEYFVTDAELGVDLTRFTEIMGMANKDSNIELELNEDTHKLDIRFDGFEYTMALLDVSTLRKSPSIPHLDLPAEITLSGAAFKRMTKAASMMGDHMTMGVEGDTFFMAAKGDSDKVRLDLTGDELIGLKSADVSSLYSLEYLSDMSKGIGSAGEVVIHLGRDLPFVLEFESSKNCAVIYILAPRIDGN